MNILRTVFVLVCPLVVAACWTNGGPSAQEIPPLASVVSLSQKVDVLAPECTSEDVQPIPQEVVDEALSTNPNLAEVFAGYTVKARLTNCQAVILVCTGDGTRGLMEDAGCNAAAERSEGDRLVDRSPPAPCDFTLVVDDSCVPAP